MDNLPLKGLVEKKKSQFLSLAWSAVELRVCENAIQMRINKHLNLNKQYHLAHLMPTLTKKTQRNSIQWWQKQLWRCVIVANLMDTASAKSRITSLEPILGTTSGQTSWHFLLSFAGCPAPRASSGSSAVYRGLVIHSLTFLWELSLGPKELNCQLGGVVESMFINHVLFKIQSKCSEGKRCQMAETENCFFCSEPEQMQAGFPSSAAGVFSHSWRGWLCRVFLSLGEHKI